MCLFLIDSWAWACSPYILGHTQKLSSMFLNAFAQLQIPTINREPLQSADRAAKSSFPLAGEHCSSAEAFFSPRIAAALSFLNLHNEAQKSINFGGCPSIVCLRLQIFDACVCPSSPLKKKKTKKKTAKISKC